jgi:ferredoxin-type protein NapH
MSTTNKLKLLTQIVFLCFFIFLLVIGWIQLWMALVLVCIIAALILGRFYCGWICPTNTIMGPFDYLGRKLKIQRRTVPKFLQSGFIRYTIFALFIVILLLTMTKGVKVPVLPILTLAAVLLTLFFPAALWHRHLCPFGVLLRHHRLYCQIGL